MFAVADETAEVAAVTTKRAHRLLLRRQAPLVKGSYSRNGTSIATVRFLISGSDSDYR
jgi:hypothetical protein